MPKTKKKPKEEVIPEKLPGEEIPKVGLAPAPGPVEDKEVNWAKVDAVVAAAKESYITGGASLVDVIDGLISTLTDMKAAEAPGLAGSPGLGAGPGMEFPPGPGPAEEEPAV